jgi:hypothetical protein
LDATRFDALARSFGERRSRRAALRGGGAGLAAVHAAASAQADDGHDPALLFVQVFGAGELAPKDGEEGAYTLTLSQGTGATLFFSDRPDRLVGTWPTAAFIERLGFTPEDPPNAALVAQTAEGEAVYVVELLAPTLDEAADTLTYDIRLLGEADVAMRFHAAPHGAPIEGVELGASHLFIDSDVFCGKHDMECYLAGTDPTTAASLGSIGKAGFHIDDGIDGTCIPDSPCAVYNDKCNNTFRACGGACYAVAPYYFRRYDTNSWWACL